MSVTKKIRDSKGEFRIFLIFLFLKFCIVMIADNEEVETVDHFSKLFKNNYSKVKYFAYVLLKSEPDAEDVAQEVFARLWERQNIWLDNEREFDSYLLIMTRNIALNIYKHEQVRQEYMEYHMVKSVSSQIDYDFFERFHYREMLGIIYSALAAIPDRRRRVFELSRFHGKSHKEIAVIMGISVHTVERQIYLTLTELRKTITAFA